MVTGMFKKFLMVKLVVSVAVIVGSCNGTSGHNSVDLEYYSAISKDDNIQTDLGNSIKAKGSGSELDQTDQSTSTGGNNEESVKDSPLYIAGEVIDVISGTEISVNTEKGIISVTYAGVFIPDSRSVIRQTVKDFNEFLVMGKVVEIEYIKLNNDSDIKLMTGFVFASGELVNLRLIENGLAVTDESIEFSRKSKFKEAQELATKLRLGIWDKDLGSICGTLPC